ncbi:hypothetical protein ACJ41O_009713 [Fusarium nematophilum]
MGRHSKNYDKNAWAKSREEQRNRPLLPAPAASTSGSGHAGSSRDGAPDDDELPSSSQAPILHDVPQAPSRSQTTAPNRRARQLPPAEDPGADNVQVQQQDRDLARQSPPRRVPPSILRTSPAESTGMQPAAIPEAEDGSFDSLMNPDDAGLDVADTFDKVWSYPRPAPQNDGPGLQHQPLNQGDAPMMEQGPSVENAFPAGILRGHHGHVDVELPPHDHGADGFCTICWDNAQLRTWLGI